VTGAPTNAPEFLGRARDFITRMDAIAVLSLPLRKHLIDSTVASARQRGEADARAIKARSPRHWAAKLRPLRPELLISIERSWLALPTGHVLSRSVVRDRKTLTAEDVLIARGKLAHTSWAPGTREPGIALFQDKLIVSSDGSAISPHRVIATLSLHAISRFMARAFRTGDEALFTDLRLLAARADCPVLPVATENGGQWFGEVAGMDSGGVAHADVMHVRSFHY
jgi:hypothetical protein